MNDVPVRATIWADSDTFGGQTVDGVFSEAALGYSFPRKPEDRWDATDEVKYRVLKLLDAGAKTVTVPYAHEGIDDESGRKWIGMVEVFSAYSHRPADHEEAGKVCGLNVDQTIIKWEDGEDQHL